MLRPTWPITLQALRKSVRRLGRRLDAAFRGPTCDGLDCIKRDAVLPPLQTGDWMFWESMGAYTAAAASSFNGFAPPQAVYYYDGVPMEAVEAAAEMERTGAATHEASQTH